MTTAPEPEAIAAAHAQGARDMRDAILRWHEEQWIYYRARSDTSGIAGAYMTAHAQSMYAVRALNVDNGEQ
jgi:hypothetical protein